MKKVLFVCSGNIHRSVIAKHILLKFVRMLGLEEEIKVRSRGLKGFLPGTELPQFPNLTHYAENWEACRETLRMLDISLSEHIAKPLEPEHMLQATTVVAMAPDIRDKLLEYFPEHAEKIILFGYQGKEGIPDMIGNSDRGANHLAILEIHRGAAHLFTSLIRQS